MGKKTPPDAKGAAEAEAAANRGIATEATYADRPDQHNAWGSLEWSQVPTVDPATGAVVTKWVQNQKFSDEMQQLYDTDMSTRNSRNTLAQGMNGRIAQEMGGAPDWAQFGDVQKFDYDPTEHRQRAEDAAYQLQANRLDPQFASQQQGLMTRLRSQGLQAGDAAYDSAMRNFNTGQNDAYAQARLSSVADGRNESSLMFNQALQGNTTANALRQQQIQEYIGKRGHALSEQEALMQGQSFSDAYSTANSGGG